jgi:microcystin-dependent protein
MTAFRRRLVLTLSLLGALAAASAAAVPNRVAYQGRLSKAGVAAGGEHVFVARILAADGTPLWSSGNIAADLPPTGEFTLTLEPTGVDWLAQEPRLEISVDGEALTPSDPFAAAPYALVAASVSDGAVTGAKLAAGAVADAQVAAGAAISASKVLISGGVTLDEWRSSQNPEKIDANVIQGTVPVSTNQIPGTALVANSSSTQTVEPTDNVTALRVKPKTGANPATVSVMEWQSESGGTVMLLKGTGDLEVSGGRVKDETGFLAPVGAVTAYAGASAPAGWLLCDGSAVSRSTYADLFAAVGTAFGAGDGSSTFNLPDLRGRAPLGAGTGSGLTARSLGASLGEEQHQLTAAEMPAHTHAAGTYAVGTDGAHAHTAGSRTDANTTGGGTENVPVGSAGSAWSTNTGGAHTHSFGGASASAGGGQGHNTLPPALVLNFIIKH